MDGISLFAGVGGFDIAMERAGITPRVIVENDPHKLKVLEQHFPDAVLIDDVKKVKGKDLYDLGLDPNNTVLVGGFPCQDLSIAGRRKGLAGARSGLFFEIPRILSEFPTRWLCLENVAGLLSANKGQDFHTVLYTLADSGYSVAYRLLDSQYAGVPQRRRRVFIVGHLGNTAAAGEVLFEPESMPRDLKKKPTQREETAGTLGGGSGNRGWAPDTDRMTFIPETTPIPIASTAVGRDGRIGGPNGLGVGQEGDPMFTLDTASPHVVAVTETIQSTRDTVSQTLTKEYDASEDGTGRGLPLVGEQTITREVTVAPPESFAENQRGDVYTAPVTQSLSKGGGKPGQGYPAVLQEAKVRRLTPVECERLQGFPDGWTEILSDSKRYQAMGDAVTVNVVERLMKRIKKLS